MRFRTLSEWQIGPLHGGHSFARALHSARNPPRVKQRWRFVERRCIPSADRRSSMECWSSPTGKS